MSIVKGEDVVLEFFDSGIWKIYACARTCTLTLTTGILETSGPGTGTWKTFKGTINEFTVSADGVVNLNMDNALSLADLRAKQTALTVLRFRYTRTDTQGNVYIDQASAIITSSSDTGNFADIATFAISLQGTGAITTTFVPSPSTGNKVNLYEYTATGGENVVNSTAFFGKNVLQAFVDGVRYKVVELGSPSGKIAVYTQFGGVGTLGFAQPFEGGELIAVEYQDL